MLKVNMSDGRTIAYDLEAKDGRKKWEDDSANEEFANKIRAINILHDGVLHSVPAPRGLGNSRLFATPVFDSKGQRIVAERIYFVFEDMEVIYTIYKANTPKMARLDIRRRGRQRFDPKILPGGN